ncbi:MAG TPA: tetratricopeptide repeat protein [Geminicoccus sp.]|uniref:O-linked N-acetylglucosamine transferase, SPINDLY family protein n=1 Tax=Geminicoccus sp. TaxID=2024832 RepID=UPI002C912337|nr:tetratricopeptide repeat protein [Geminicoccus sp.]HWL69988.1 tetratricopeptide repeat protein [Geminicoccus sp.]
MPGNTMLSSQAVLPAGHAAVDGRRSAAQALLLAAAERHRAMDYAAARDLYRQVLRTDPEQADAVHLLGMALAALGDVAKGERLVRQSIALRPERARFWSNLGNLLNRSGRMQVALKAFSEAIRRDATFADAPANLAGVLASLQRYDAAEAAARDALELDPNHPTGLANLAGALIGLGRYIEAEPHLRRAQELAPKSYEVWYNLGHLSMARGRADEAEQAFRRARELDPGAVELLRWLGYACVRTRKAEEAELLLRHYLTVRPAPSNAHSMLGHLLVQRGMHEQGIELLRQGISRPNAQAAEHSTLVFDLNYCPDLDPLQVRAEHERWGRRFALPHVLRNRKADTDRDPHRRLRVGFLSPDLRGHSVAYFFLPLLRHLDQTQIETFCYAYVDTADAMTAALKQAADHWRDVWGIADDEIARRIRDDCIDILVDLAGHTSDSRLLVLARRPAPVQATYLGYPNTTGMPAVDWRIVDEVTDPAGADAYAVEQLLRLDRCFLTYEPVEFPGIVEPPCVKNGFVTFGSFNNMAKLNESVFELWARILQRVEGSRLLLKHHMSHDPVVQEKVRQAFSGRRIAPERIELLPRTHGRASHLATYGRIDVALDTFPYGGTTTTCEALWMGVPVVTLAGDTHVARVGASILHSIGLHSCVARSADDYLLTATQLASTRDLLAGMRQMLRSEMLASPLMDQADLGRHMTAAFRTMWHRYCGIPTRAAT